MSPLTHEEKLAGFDQILAVDLTPEERFWIEKFREFLVLGVFHDTWARLRVQAPHLERIVLSAIMKARNAAAVNV